METPWFGFQRTSSVKQLDKAFGDPGAYPDFLKTVYREHDEGRTVFKTIEPLSALWVEESAIKDDGREYLLLQARVKKWFPAGFEA